MILEPQADGLVREMRSTWTVGGETLRSAFTYQSELPPNLPVRIDYSIRNSSCAVESTVQRAHALGLEVVAEVVETEWVRDHLRSIGYDLGQGYFFARPMAGDDVCNWARHFNGSDPQKTLATRADRAAS